MNDSYSFLNDIHIIEYLYNQYKINPNSLDPSWRYFFSGFNFGKENYEKINIQSNKFISSLNIKKEFFVLNLIHSYKEIGHYFGKINPIKKNIKPNDYSLDLKNFGLSNKDLDINFEAGNLIKLGKTSLRNIINYLNNTYCGSLGIEYLHITNPEKINWIEKWIYKKKNNFSSEEKKFFLKKLNEAVKFENFLHNKFVGKKRFSIEGNESILPMLEDMVKYSYNNYFTEEFIIGMSHRGRLNILTNFFGKDLSNIFNEFQDKEYEDKSFSGDVKYHLGYSSEKNIYDTNGNRGNIKIYLLPNPSHLESVNPIVIGMTRAKIDYLYKKNLDKIIPVIIHGDASISGQGIVYEALQLSKLKGYQTGGAIHIIINNQIGFTTNEFESRSTWYCTDIAKTFSIPILHVNAESIESVIRSIRFAIDFRMYYKEDVFIDLIGYRKYGHNEGDEPRFTQPILYKEISNRSNCYDLYKEKLIRNNIINNTFLKKIEEEYIQILNKKYKESKNIKWNYLNNFLLDDKYSIFNNDIFQKIDTKLSVDIIKYISKIAFTLPKEKNFFKKTKKIFQKRLEMIENNQVDWSMAEILAYGSLLYDGFCIRLSGEDVARGTFSQRHIVVKTEEEEELILLNKIENNSKPVKIEIYNSPLSEYGVLGFDYGYAMGNHNTLTLWEAQFGDFSNGAQIIIDQYISSGESKWKIQNGIVLLLPHGYEGQGPEHSSARIERYVQLCAKNNLFIVNCTSPDNFYHLLRRHMKLKFRKPLIVFTPKSLLRNKNCLSSIKDLSNGGFQEIIDDTINANKVKRIIFCSGKIYYELLNKRETIRNNNTALIRIEQIYPLNINNIKRILNKYKNNIDIIWVQEEPENMGLWSFILRKLRNIIKIKLISPNESSSPSVGSYNEFLKIHYKIIEKSFNFKN
ncbi:2-oxoglutarate dehydrogenase E1 component [Blattabacterium cuenoti]